MEPFFIFVTVPLNATPSPFNAISDCFTAVELSICKDHVIPVKPKMFTTWKTLLLSVLDHQRRVIYLFFMEIIINIPRTWL